MVSSDLYHGLLDNATLLSMLASGLADDIIISKIRISECAFDTSSFQLAALKQQGVSDAILAVMLENHQARS